MMSLSAVLVEIEASAEKIMGLDAALATERENGKTLVQHYREQSADALKILGIDEAPERKPRSQQAVLMSAARRIIRQTVKGGEKNAKAILAAAFAAADKTA